MGGRGKSQLALEYCQHVEKDLSYRAIFWIDAMSAATIEKSLISVAQKLSKPGFDATDVEGNVRYALTTISTWQEPWLLVFDNFDDLRPFDNKSIKEHLPRSITASVLITRRDGAAKAHHIDVRTLSTEETLKLLFRRTDATLQAA